jgi:hypothetical protein
MLGPPTPPPPVELAVPASDSALVLRAPARGVQQYRCTASTGGSGYGWTLLGPRAELFDDAGRPVARHYAGPTWEAADGGKVVGAVVAKTASPDGAGVDWLLLKAKASPLTGAFAAVSYIRRLQTQGGQAPATGCTAATAGAAADVPYSAVYEFYRPRQQ